MGYLKDDTRLFCESNNRATMHDDPAIVTVSDQPDNDPINFEVKKVDKETGEVIQGDANLIWGAIYCEILQQILQ